MEKTKKITKSFVSKLASIPYTYTIVTSLVILILGISIAEGTITMTSALTVIGLAIVIALHFTIGFSFFKTMFSFVAIIYTTSLYTNSVMNISGNVVEPFLLTLASITVFLATTYSKTNHQWSLRSRPLWSALLVFILVPFKLTLISQGFSFLFSEIMGLNVTVVYIFIWRYWAAHSKKTKMEKPTVIKEETKDNFKIIFIEDSLNVDRLIWNDYKARNALPYIYNEVMKANESKANLVLVSNSASNKLFDMRSIKLNRSKEIEYIYLQDKDGKFLNSALNSFKEELSLKG